MMLTPALVMAVTMLGAIIAITRHNMVHAIFGLALALGGVALSFLLFGSPFVAAMEVLIYIGGITVAMVFAVMLSPFGRIEPARDRNRHLLAGVIAAAFFGVVAWAITKTNFGPVPSVQADAWSVAAIGRDVLDRFNVVFEVLSVVLLLAIVGAITIASREDERAATEPRPRVGGGNA